MAGANKILVAGVLVATAAGAVNQSTEVSLPGIVVRLQQESIVDVGVLLGAEAIATRMFAGIGLWVRWTATPSGRDPACGPNQPQEIIVRMEPGARGEGANSEFGLARPYATTGVRVTVFYSEIRRAGRRDLGNQSAILAHVLVHEITHVLEGIDMHSGEGLMRAHWTPADFSNMRTRPLAFSADDVWLIRRGMEMRQSVPCAGKAPVTSR